MYFKFGNMALVLALLFSATAWSQQNYGPQAAMEEAKLAISLTPDLEQGRELYKI